MPLWFRWFPPEGTEPNYVTSTATTTTTTTGYINWSSLTTTNAYDSALCAWDRQSILSLYQQQTAELVGRQYGQERLRMQLREQGAIAANERRDQLWSAIRARPARDMGIAKPAIILDAARKRAREHLLSHLTPEQRQTFEAHGWFVVEGGRSGTRYRVNGNTLVGNVEVFDRDRVTHRLCAHGDRHDIPMDDHILAQKFWLEAAEDDFLRVANRHAVR